MIRDRERLTCDGERATADRSIQELPGHKDVSTTMIYTRVLNKRRHGVRSPVDDL